MNVKRPKLWKSELYIEPNQFCGNIEDSSLTPICLCGREMKCVHYEEKATTVIKFWRCYVCESFKEVFYQIYMKNKI